MKIYEDVWPDEPELIEEKYKYSVRRKCTAPRYVGTEEKIKWKYIFI